MATAEKPARRAMSPSAGARWRDWLRRFLELFAFSGLAVAQPVLDSFGNAPEHFVFRGASSTDIVLFALVVALGPPAALFLATQLVRTLSGRVGQVAHVSVLAILGGFAGVQLGWRVFDLKSVPLAMVGLAIAALVTALYFRTQSFAVWARYLAVLPVVAVASFLVASPVSDLVGSGSADVGTVAFDETPPIVVLMFDELPTATLMDTDGTIDAQLFPNFARLGEVATWYRNNSTNSNNTILALPAFLTGRVPEKPGATLANYPENLFTMLGGTYRIRADEAPIQLCPDALCESVSTAGGGLERLLQDARRLWRAQVSLADPGGTVFDLLEETVSVAPVEGASDDTSSEEFAEAFREADRLMTTSPARLASFLDAIRPSDVPTLNYLHLQIPHGPFRFYPNGVEYVRPDAIHDSFTRYSERLESEAPARVDRQRHILQTQYADALLGQLLDRLEDQALLDESVLVVAADHGIGFEPLQTPRLSSEEPLPPTGVDDVFWSPLFMKAAGQDIGELSDVPTQLFDVLPTLAGWLGADPGWEFDGRPVDSLAADAQRTLCRPLGAETEAGLDDVGSATIGCAKVDDGDVLSELLDSAVGLFLPDDDSELRVYRAGRFGGLVGQSTADVEMGDPASVELNVTGSEGFADVRVQGPLTGMLSGAIAPAADEIVVAIALNGTVAGIAETFSRDGQSGLLEAMLPHSLYVAGSNRLEAFIVAGDEDAPVLHPAIVGEG